jgi:hypothetical protein
VNRAIQKRWYTKVTVAECTTYRTRVDAGVVALAVALHQRLGNNAKLEAFNDWCSWIWLRYGERYRCLRGGAVNAVGVREVSPTATMIGRRVFAEVDAIVEA